MKNRKTDRSNLLRWYPHKWQERYGDEFKMLLEDTLRGKRPTAKFRLTIALAGLRERGHYAGVIENSSSPSDCAKAGSLVVLIAWTAFLFAGFSFSKLSEHFGAAVPESSHTHSSSQHMI